MANYLTDFTEYSTGAIPSDWTARWDSTTEWTVELGGADKVLLWTPLANNRSLCSWNDVDADADRANVEILTKYKTNISSSSQNGGAALRASGSGTAETGYVAQIFDDNLEIRKFVAATTSVVASQALALSTDTFYHLRFRANGSSLKAKIWLATDTEPASWGIDTTDTSIAGAGWNGAFTFFNVSQPSYDTFAVATNGDTASFGASGSSGTIAAALGAFTASMSGTTTIVGSIAVTAQNDTSNITGTTGSVSGSIAQTLDNNVGNLQGTTGSVSGTIAATAQNDTSNIAGTTTVVGSMAQTTANATSAITGTTSVTGSIAKTLENDVGNFQGTTAIVGSIAKTLENDVGNFQGSTGSTSGTIAVTTENNVANMAGTTAVVGNLNASTENATSNITGTTTILGQISSSISNFISSIFGTSGSPSLVARLLSLLGVGP